MLITYLAVAEHRFYVLPENLDSLMAAAVIARARGEWLDFLNAAGQRVRILLPSQALLEAHEYEIDDDPEPGNIPSVVQGDWMMVDYDM